MIAQSVEHWAMGWTIGVLGFDSQEGLGIFLFITASRPAMEPTQSPIQWVPWALSLGVKRPGREADHSPPSSAEVKECVELYLHSRNTPSWCGAHLKHRDNFTFTFNVMLIVKWFAATAVEKFRVIATFNTANLIGYSNVVNVHMEKTVSLY
jgi:hypothetical protein